MSMHQSSSRKAWKVLLLALFGCTVAFVLVVSSVVYWVASITNRARRDAERTAIEQIHLEASRAAETNLQKTELVQPVSSALAKEGAGNSGLGEDDSKSVAAEDIFSQGVIPSLHIKIPFLKVLALRRDGREYVSATIEEGARTYSNVAIRLKGGPGSYRSIGDLPAFTVNFDKNVPGQTFHGLKKLHLNNSVQDRSFLEEKISRELFEAAGIPAPRAGHAVVTLNGRTLGMYVLVEGVNKQFLKRHFADAKGNVYDGHSGTDVTDRLPVNCGEDSDQSALDALAEAARERNFSARLSSLEKTLDLDRFLSFVA